ncbi:hypothetical protein [Agromyces sp. Marseille-P2726]|uniref:hypothetical protein n=1 Tax=Agromyces sp. Marseille-P2726 TaxID=2709132 RepID=UPI001570C152|nr:hypothetical protein [Agromyces sp. Marseille-P2726]
MTDPGTDRTPRPRPADAPQPTGKDGEIHEGPDVNDLDADNAVEADSIETLQPDNPPA